MKPVSLALAGRFISAVPSGKPWSTLSGRGISAGEKGAGLERKAAVS